MTKTTKTAMVLMGIGLAWVAGNNIKYKLAERKRIAKIDAETIAEFEAGLHAQKVILERIFRGEYKDRPIQEIIDDFQFEQIAARINN